MSDIASKGRRMPAAAAAMYRVLRNATLLKIEGAPRAPYFIARKQYVQVILRPSQPSRLSWSGEYPSKLTKGKETSL